MINGSIMMNVLHLFVLILFHATYVHCADPNEPAPLCKTRIYDM